MSDNNRGSFTFLYDLTRVPCFRDTMLYSMAGASALAALRYSRTRNGMIAADTAVKSFTVFAITGWVLCRYNYRHRRDMIYEGIHRNSPTSDAGQTPPPPMPPAGQ
mmetsp:Transcript_9168/g.18608  ORF Transcript_9168/g.18608 Transcript_9168/m.18608 type:complete len:106 (-) Transcript_9168:5180-5497(-)